MSLQLLKYLNGAKNGGLKKFIDDFEEKNTEPRICWYPSSYNDFSALCFLHPSFSINFPLTNENIVEPISPDIFIFSDYIFHGTTIENLFLGIEEINKSYKFNIRFENIESLPKLRMSTKLNPEIVAFPKNNRNINKAFFLNCIINNEISTPLIYVGAVNETFCAEILVPNHTILSHIFRVRYGGGLGGGGRAKGYWIKNVLRRFKTEVYIADKFEKICEQSGDIEAIRQYQSLQTDEPIPTLEKIREVQRVDAYGDLIFWYLVK